MPLKVEVLTLLSAKMKGLGKRPGWVVQGNPPYGVHPHLFPLESTLGV